MSETASSEKTMFRVGTLEYTRRGLFAVFLWLLWGDFCFTLMETVEPSVLPLVLKDLGASNLIISTFIITIAYALNVTVCPVVSFMSDRYRSRWGRRIPFMLFSTPFVALFLVLTGFCREIGKFLFTHFFHHAVSSETALTIGIIAVFVAGYQFFNMFVASVYYYLFNDVVPVEYLGRFMSVFRAVGTGAGALFNFFVLQFARTHSKEIFAGFGILYFVGFMIMCLRVKEGGYPPPPEMKKGENSTLAGIKTFFKESFCHRFYWYFNLSYSFWCVGLVIGIFSVFRSLNIGLTLKELGMITGVSGIVSTVLLIPAGHYIDKNHPIRVGLSAMIWLLVSGATNIIFLWSFPHRTVLILTIITTAVSVPIGVLLTACELPLFMRLLPQSRYGQFCSATMLVKSAMVIAAGVAAGYFMDGLKWFCQVHLHIQGDYYYRLSFIWTAVFLAVAVYYRVKLYKLWLKLGGDDGYLPPMFEADELALRASQATASSTSDASDCLDKENACL